MGVTTNQKAITRNLDEDYTFYTGETSLVRVEEGCLLFFFSDDLHALCAGRTTLRLRKWL
jgi:beta-galactosidase beta subunit